MQLALLVAALTSALGAAAPTGKYEGSVPFIIDITADFKSAAACDFEINVKVAHQDIKCPGESVAMSDTGVTFPNIANAGDCMGDNLRGQKKDVSKYSLDINSDGTLTFHSDGYPNMKLTKKSTLLVQDTCSLYAINGDTCGQSDLDCKYTKYAKAAEKSLQDGTCSSQGYTVKGKVTTKSYPVIGDITITEYTKAALLVQDTCSLYAINGDTCGQSDLDCKYTKYAKAAEKSLQDGTCSSQGYTVKGKVTTKSYPVIGDITITDYTKPAVIVV